MNPEYIRVHVGHIRGLIRSGVNVNAEDRAFVALADLVEAFVIELSKIDGHDPVYDVHNSEAFNKLRRVCPL